MQLHLKAGDGDLLLIVEPALLMRCAWQSHAKYRPALVLCNIYGSILVYYIFKTLLQLTRRSWNWLRSTASWKRAGNWRTSWVRRGSVTPPKIAKSCQETSNVDQSWLICGTLSWLFVWVCHNAEGLMLKSKSCWTMMLKTGLVWFDRYIYICTDIWHLCI